MITWYCTYCNFSPSPANRKPWRKFHIIARIVPCSLNLEFINCINVTKLVCNQFALVKIVDVECTMKEVDVRTRILNLTSVHFNDRIRLYIRPVSFICIDALLQSSRIFAWFFPGINGYAVMVKWSSNH